MNSYKNQMGAFENSVEQSKSQLNNFTNRRDEIIGDNKKLLANAKALQSSDLIQGVVSTMSGVVGLKALKTTGGKALSWVDKKLGGKIAKDTKGFNELVKKKGKQLLQKGVKQATDKVNKVRGVEEEDGVELGDASTESKTESSAKSKMEKDTGEKGTSEQKESGEVADEEVGDTIEPRSLDQNTQYEYGEDGMTQEEAMRIRDAGGEGGKLTDAEEKSAKDFGEGAEDDISAENKFEDATKAVKAENEGIDETNKADGADEEDDAGEGEEEDAGEVVEDAGENVAEKEAIGDTMEGVGTGLDATGIGAVVGVPLQIAGAITDLVGVVEAGKSFGDWFNEDVLGNKPPVKAQHIALPNAPSTLASQGFQATPSYSSAVEVGGGAGGW